jgi:cytochrome b involved in lipid metabolism/predicted NAD/FAD-dependent oxidoreductase
MYDYLIVGAGISGLYTAYRLFKKYPTAKICILEATQYIGGRLHSIKYDGLIMDGGGARFNTEQKRIIGLIKEVGLWNKIIPITSDITYKPVNENYSTKTDSKLLFTTIDDFILYMKKYIKDKHISRDTLINTTILDFATKHFSKEHPDIKQNLINIYPYYSELGVLNAVEGLNLFSNEFSDKTKYYILNGGLEQLADTLYTKLKKIDIYKETPVFEISNQEETDIESQTTYNITTSDNKIFATKNLILTIPKNKLLNIKFKLNSSDPKTHSTIKNKLKQLHKNINSVQNEPLYRIYARYPLDKTTHKVWFDGMSKIATNLPIKYIIPINYEKGVIMISYTDSKFARYWFNKMADGSFEVTLNKQLKLLFPDIVIPKPKWYKHCPWNSGAGYWKKGYDRKLIMSQMIEPLGKNTNLYICGENYSSHQAWVEGALETADMVLDKVKMHKDTHRDTHKDTHKKKKTMLGGSKKTKKKSSKSTKQTEYTLEEVSKHNKKSDAWIVIHNKVADVTKWIPSHPGGDIIMKGVGKDATTLFDNIGHGDYAKKMLKKFQIGILKK